LGVRVVPETAIEALFGANLPRAETDWPSRPMRNPFNALISATLASSPISLETPARTGWDAQAGYSHPAAHRR
jgi:hypothetical protein